MLKKRRGNLLYLFLSCSFFLLFFLRDPLGGIFSPLDAAVIDYDEYDCGCPRYGPSTDSIENKSLCSDWSTSRGPNQNVVSYSLYGDPGNADVYDKYFKGFIERVEDVKNQYDGWVIRLYHNMSFSDLQSRDYICFLYCRFPQFDPCNVNNIYTDQVFTSRSSSNVNEGRQNLTGIETRDKFDQSDKKNSDYDISNNYFRETLKNEYIEHGKVVGKAKRSSSVKENVEDFDFFSKNFQVRNENIAILAKRLGLPLAPDLRQSYGQRLVGKVWRFLAMADPLVSEFLIRDTDSEILDREVAAVEQWRKSSAILHAMRDHPFHNGFILAGMWGGSRRRGGPKLTQLFQEMSRKPSRNTWDFDQVLLKRVVWPEMLDDMLVHDSYFCVNPFFRSKHRSLAFPTQREGRYFVGWGRRRDPAELAGIIPCPKECRPSNHLDWKFC